MILYWYIKYCIGVLSWNDLLQKSECYIAEDVEHVTSVCVNDVYMFMGRELDALDEVPAGNILGVCASCVVWYGVHGSWTGRLGWGSSW